MVLPTKSKKMNNKKIDVLDRQKELSDHELFAIERKDEQNLLKVASQLLLNNKQVHVLNVNLNRLTLYYANSKITITRNIKKDGSFNNSITITTTLPDDGINLTKDIISYLKGF